MRGRAALSWWPPIGGDGGKSVARDRRAEPTATSHPLSLNLFRDEHRSVTDGSAGSTNHLLGQTGGFGTHLPNWGFMPYGRGAKSRYTRVRPGALHPAGPVFPPAGEKEHHVCSSINSLHRPAAGGAHRPGCGTGIGIGAGHARHGGGGGEHGHLPRQGLRAQRVRPHGDDDRSGHARRNVQFRVRDQRAGPGHGHASTAATSRSV
jgi:hypothetical protein